MTKKIFSSNKKQMIFLGFEILAIAFAMLFLINLKIISVKEITHYNVISSLLMAFGAFILISGLKKRSFALTENDITFINKDIKFKTNFDDIYLVRIFRADNSRIVTLGIVTEPDKEVFQVSTAFFEPKTLRNVAIELSQIAEKHEFLVEDEVGWLEIPVQKDFNNGYEA